MCHGLFEIISKPCPLHPPQWLASAEGLHSYYFAKFIIRSRTASEAGNLVKNNWQWPKSASESLLPCWGWEAGSSCDLVKERPWSIKGVWYHYKQPPTAGFPSHDVRASIKNREATYLICPIEKTMEKSLSFRGQSLLTVKHQKVTGRYIIIIIR